MPWAGEDGNMLKMLKVKVEIGGTLATSEKLEDTVIGICLRYYIYIIKPSLMGVVPSIF